MPEELKLEDVINRCQERIMESNRGSSVFYGEDIKRLISELRKRDEALKVYKERLDKDHLCGWVNKEQCPGCIITNKVSQILRGEK